ncbi:DUF397 domain-containing protein [Actinoalloteichus hymeniacidonis]|uniref:DUF397 family protein n=1 Tax=Actinoalloteichus hymeniacidonis TaxID=340345 RepID=A0AAC9N025_9PSEU|nr:DUF397 domain-containing protein [Actinoalloteichus hymeniacidonis]AOS64637.1 putative DUF397 family protein [Actinoalloteichus hymeniacidonis]MBB5907289.1 hypothetical protein [Actinoalloteichus hymeniacidonis]
MTLHLTPDRWWTSTRTAQLGACVEIGVGVGVIGIRDTKDRDGGTLLVDRAVFGAFVASIKADRLD